MDLTLSNSALHVSIYIILTGCFISTYMSTWLYTYIVTELNSILTATLDKQF